MRSVAIVLALAVSATSATLAACGSFGASDPPATTPPAADASADASGPGTCDVPTLFDQPGAPLAATCAGAPVDLKTDPSNCGACGHACEGACVGGACERQRVLDGEIATAIVVDGVAYFVTPGKQVSRAPLGAAAHDDFGLIASPTPRLALDGGKLWISDDKEQITFDLQTKLQDDVPLGKAPTGGALVLGATSYLYAWSTATGATVEKVAKGTAAAPAEIGSAAVGALAMSDDDGYWFAKPTDKDPFMLYGPFPNNEKPLASADQPVGMAVDATHVYFFDQPAKQLKRVDREGGSAQPVAKEDGVVSRIAMDGDYLYWVADRGAEQGVVVVRVAKCGGRPLTLASTLAGVNQLSFDDRYVYGANFAPGVKAELFRVPK